MINKNNKPVGESAQYNVFKLVHVSTNKSYYSKAIIDQCPDVDRFLNKNYRMSKTHKTPGGMLRHLKNTLISEWGVQLLDNNVSKTEANILKKMYIEEDRKCESTFMSK